MEQSFKVQIPGGYLCAESKGAYDEYPGIFITFTPDGESDIQNDLVACVEWITPDKEIRIESYCAQHDNPVSIRRYDDGKELW